MSYFQTLAPRLPLNLGGKVGYEMMTNIRQTTKQILKCLLLTAPGERTMIPDFGVGLKKFLFQNYGPELKSNVKVNIRQQVQRYMPFIGIENCKILFGNEVGSSSGEESNTLFISIKYIIKSYAIVDSLDVTIKND